MKTNCPHCQGIIVIPVRCCNGDEAIQGVFMPEQYEKIQLEAERKIKKELLKKEFHEKMKQFNVDTKFFFLAIFCSSPIAIALFFLIPFIFPGINMSDPDNISEICTIFTFPVMFSVGGISLFASNRVSKAFFKKYPEYAEFNINNKSIFEL